MADTKYLAREKKICICSYQLPNHENMILKNKNKLLKVVFSSNKSEILFFKLCLNYSIIKIKVNKLPTSLDLSTINNEIIYLCYT